MQASVRVVARLGRVPSFRVTRRAGSCPTRWGVHGRSSAPSRQRPARSSPTSGRSVRRAAGFFRFRRGAAHRGFSGRCTVHGQVDGRPREDPCRHLGVDRSKDGRMDASMDGPPDRTASPDSRRRPVRPAVGAGVRPPRLVVGASARGGRVHCVLPRAAPARPVSWSGGVRVCFVLLLMPWLRVIRQRRLGRAVGSGGGLLRAARRSPDPRSPAAAVAGLGSRRLGRGRAAALDDPVRRAAVGEAGLRAG